MEGERKPEFSLQCPVPAPDQLIQMAHGGGGRAMHRLLEEIFLPGFANPALEARHDGAYVQAGTAKLAFTTDSYVVRPLFFPGGNIGDLAVNGTVNDLAMCGARPLALSAAFVLEEGLETEILARITDSMRRAAERARVSIVTGDTKVVEKGKGDKLFITTAGIGLVETGLTIGPAAVCPGDVIIVSGDLGRHGIAILSVREGLEFGGEILSDTAPLWESVEALLNAGITVHCLRDLTRGGLTAALHEIAQTRGCAISIREGCISCNETVEGACELLGLDPLLIANEGRFLAVVPRVDAERTVDILRRVEVSSEAVVIGEVQESPSGEVVLETTIGSRRLLDLPFGDPLPRIC